MKKIIIIAGPNGAGKTTFARDFLPAEAQTLRFINADLIAAGLAPFNPESASIKAGRLMLEEIDECVASGQSFAFETTLSGKGYLRKITLWQQLGYQVKLWFLSLPSEDIAISRVAERVVQGGTISLSKSFADDSSPGLKIFMSSTAKSLTHGLFTITQALSHNLLNGVTNEHKRHSNLQRS